MKTKFIKTLSYIHKYLFLIIFWRHKSANIELDLKKEFKIITNANTYFVIFN